MSKHYTVTLIFTSSHTVFNTITLGGPDPCGQNLGGPWPLWLPPPPPPLLSPLFLRQCVQCILSVCETNTPLYCCTTTPVTALPSPLVVKLLDSLLVQCKNGCGEVMEQKHLKNLYNCTTIEIPPSQWTTCCQPHSISCRPTPWACWWTN